MELRAGETAILEIELADEDLCYYDPANGWELEACNYRFRLGQSSDELLLESYWCFNGASWSPK
jgi:hypothetical protein